MSNKNKVRYGLKNVHYAALTSTENGTVSYGTPVAWPGAVSIKFSAQGSQEPFYADDIKYYVTSSMPAIMAIWKQHLYLKILERRFSERSKMRTVSLLKTPMPSRFHSHCSLNLRAM